jgi:hypothetical protein
MSPRQLALKVAICVLAGAALTAGVAWGFREQRIRAARSAKPFSAISVTPNFMDGESGRTLAEACWRGAPAAYLLLVLPPKATTVSDVRLYFFSGGWPMLAMASAPHSVTDHPLYERKRVFPVAAFEDRFPLFPLWPGFALDTVFYGAIVFLFWAAPGAIRRRARKRRGHCPTCNYDLKATPAGPCPECGSPSSTSPSPSSGGPAQPDHSA